MLNAEASIHAINAVLNVATLVLVQRVLQAARDLYHETRRNGHSATPDANRNGEGS